MHTMQGSLSQGKEMTKKVTWDGFLDKGMETDYSSFYSLMKQLTKEHENYAVFNWADGKLIDPAESTFLNGYPIKWVKYDNELIAFNEKLYNEIIKSFGIPSHLASTVLTPSNPKHLEDPIKQWKAELLQEPLPLTVTPPKTDKNGDPWLFHHTTYSNHLVYSHNSSPLIYVDLVDDVEYTKKLEAVFEDKKKIVEQAQKEADFIAGKNYVDDLSLAHSIAMAGKEIKKEQETVVLPIDLDSIYALKRNERHCWFSKKQNDKCFGIAGKSYFMIRGKEQLISQSSKQRSTKINWDDVIYLGIGTFSRYEEGLMDSVLNKMSEEEYETYGD